MVLALGVYFSLAIGTSDFLGGYLARRVDSFTAVVTFLCVGTLTAASMMTFVPSELLWRDVGFGALGGLTVGFALVLLYHGMTVASASVVSPVTGVLTATIPVGWSIATGESLTGFVVVGIVVALVGLTATTFSPELGDRAIAGVGWGLASGTCFGVSLTFIGQADAESGMWTTVAQRAVALLVLAMIALGRSVPLLVPRSLARVGIVGGILAGSGVGAFVAGAQRGSLSEITVTASMFPAVTVVLAALFEQHPLRWWQLGGLVTVVTGVVLIGVG
ncbi:MAG: EamA family transporter [Acidimicrobiales bacterium]